ncbi:MAG: molecular chaperone HtpG [Candidatus Sumerlaeia bacterium]
MTADKQTLEFQSEARQVLDLMIHSVYTHPEIFLRELISNASDALDKLRFEALTNKAVQASTDDLHIMIEADPKARTLTVRDNGIGMSREEVIQYIGTIARSGSREFLRALQEARREGQLTPELIGRFGVGFYSCFMVADRVTLETRRATGEPAVRWESTGDGTYTLEEIEWPEGRQSCGTAVTLHLKPTGGESGIEDDYCQEWRIREIVRKYSNYVAYPIRMEVERQEREGEGEGATTRTVRRVETLNSMKAIWLRSETEVGEEEYKEFYRHISHDWNDPLRRISYRVEGTQEFRALLFLPSKAPLDLYFRERHHGVHLYIKRVFIMNDCKDLLPEWLRFVRGVVDSEDLPLNISRETLQHNRQVAQIRKALVKKVLDTLEAMKRDEPEIYRQFWGEFGRVLKEGLYQDFAHQESLLGLMLAHSTHEAGALTSLDDYLNRMKPEQEGIYYLTGESLETLKGSPHLEAFRDKGYEVLLLTDPIDELWTSVVAAFREKPFQSVARGAVQLGTEEEKKQAEADRKTQEGEFKALLETLQDRLKDHVKEVRLSGRLRESPACLVGEAGDASPQLEQMLKALGQDAPRIKRILEINPTHPMLQKLRDHADKFPNDPVLGDYAELLLGQALLAEGRQPPDPARFSRLVAQLMIKALRRPGMSGGG